jgi:hypothetical protein
MNDKEFITQSLRPLPLAALQHALIECTNNPEKILLNGSVHTGNMY